MTVSACDFAASLGLPANDVAVRCQAVDAAVVWACQVFRVDDEAELDELGLDASQLKAIVGYADAKKLDKATFGYFAGGNVDEIPAAIGNLSKRWRPMLIGERSFGFA